MMLIRLNNLTRSQAHAAMVDWLIMQVLQKICWFVVLAATSSDQVTLLNSTAADKKLEGLPEYKELLQTFITQEVKHYITLHAGVSDGVQCKVL